MVDFRLTTVAQASVPANNQFNSFAEGQGWLVDELDPDTGAPTGNKVAAPDVSIYAFLNDNGEFRWDVRLYGQKGADDFSGAKPHPNKVDENGDPIIVAGSNLREAFETNGTKIADKLVERRRAVYDENGEVIGDEVYATGDLEVWRWQNVILIGDVVDGEWPGNLIEHTWL